MSKPIEYVPITELLKDIVDNRGKSVPTAPTGTPLIATNCIQHSSIYPTFEKVRFVDDKTLKTWFRAHLQPNDILFVNKGTPGRVCLVPDPVNFCAAQDMIGFRCDETKINYKYLFAVLRSDEIQKKIENFHVGLVIPHFRKQDLPSLMIPMRSPEEQEAIGNLYITLSEKIELNARINAELESMAKTLYDYWFVQFAPHKSAGWKMVWNDELKREIPLGWEVGSLLDIADYMNGLPCQKFRPTGKEFLRVIKIREMRDGFTEDSELVRPDIPERAIIENGDVLFSWSASLEVMIWSGGKGALNQHIFKVTSEKYPKSFYYFQLLNYLQHFKMMAENRKTTMGHITQDHLKQSRIVLPPKELTEELEKIIAPIFEKIIVNRIESQTLTELRDWLLPMLMNGQARVK